MRILSLSPILLLGVAAHSLYAQSGSLTCTNTAVPALVRAEGIAERLGDIVISCSGTPGREVSGNLTLTLNTTVTNRVLSGNNLDVVLTVSSGAGETPANVPATLAGNNQVTWSGLRFNVGSNGAVALRIANLRGDASFGGSTLPPQFGAGSLVGTAIVANLAFNGASLLNFTTTSFSVGVPQRGLYATTLTTVVPNQLGSPIPDPIGFSELIQAGTLFASTRVTEGHQSAFEPRQAQTDSGTRILLRFSGYPPDARLFVPAAIAGANAEVPTIAGDFGGVVSGGRCTPGSGTLCLTRVIGTDPNGSSGYQATASFGDTATFNTMTEVQLSNGSGVAVYEVIDANPQLQESAQIPVFIGLPRSQTARNSTLQLQVTFAPVSTVNTATSYAPIPRFTNTNAPTDCGTFRDCSLYVPKLGAPPVNTTFTLVQGVGVEQRLIPLSNEGGGLMPWSATVEYKNGSNWILLDPTSGLQPLLIRMIVTARTELQPGKYEATIVIDAGAAGVARYPVTLTVIAPPEPPKPKPVISAVQHGATFQAGAIARGSYITLRGTGFAASNVSVTIDGKSSKISYASSDQINVLVPEEIGSNTTQVIVTVNGISSDAKTVEVTSVSPGIFTPGILNQDGSVNSASNPANTGSYVQIFATGLLPPNGSGVVEAVLHTDTLQNLPYAGPAPGIPGLQQVNLKVTEGLPTMQTNVSLCTITAGGRVCSAPAQIWIRQVQ